MCSQQNDVYNKPGKTVRLSKFRENKLSLLYESENFIIIDKPFDMYINSNDKNEENTVAWHIAAPDSHLATSARPLHFVHRLDYATSGVLCVAKSRRAAARAGALFQQRAARKYYLAVLRGHLRLDAADILYPVGELKSAATTNHKMLAIKTDEDKEQCQHTRSAETRLLVLERGYYDGAEATIVMLKPNTGRRHQLRAHCLALGHPVLGDYTYSDGADHAPHRMFLHAARLALDAEGLDVRTEDPFAADARFAAAWTVCTGPGLSGGPPARRADLAAACARIDRLARLPTYTAAAPC